MAHPATLPAGKTPFYRSLYAQVLVGIVLAIIVGNFFRRPPST